MCILMQILKCFLNKKALLFVSELYIYQNARSNDEKKCQLLGISVRMWV